MDLYPLARAALFRLEAEEAHQATLRLLRLGAGRVFRAQPPNPLLRTGVFGLYFPNPLGLAPGFDKNGEVPAAMLALGLGYVEVGTVTPRPQAGNPRPRVFRLIEDGALINRLGFNNQGMAAVAERLHARRPDGLIGINIGANKETSDKAADYVAAFERLHPYADYITVNVSSPNTPGLRGLQDRAQLEALLARLLAARGKTNRKPPLFLKIAPDLAEGALGEIVAVCRAAPIDGLIVSNTTIGRAGLESPHARETGGLSGRPLFALSTAVLARAFVLAEGRLPLIGVGGIDSAEAAYAKIRAGASLLQLYTALVYQGPGLVARILGGLADHLSKDGFAAIGDAVGVDAERLASSAGV